MKKQSDYATKLKDPRWQKKRLGVLERDDFRCQHCGDKESTLHVHHLHYTTGDPWEIDNDLLVTLCEICHEEESQDIKDASHDLIRILKSKGVDAATMNLLANAMISLPSSGQNEAYKSIDIIYHFINNPELWAICDISRIKDIESRGEGISV